MSSSSITDLWGNTVDLTPTSISYRSRLVNVDSIQTVHIKGKRLLINTFKQNQGSPTMCIFFATKEDVNEAYDLVKEVCFGAVPKQTKESSWEAFMYLMMAVAIPVVISTLVFRTC
jgi:hypothetical protein